MTGHLELFIDLSEATKNTQIMIEKEEDKKEKKSEKSEAYDINNLKNTLENRLIKIRPLICK